MAAIVNPGQLPAVDSSLIKVSRGSRGYGTNIPVSTKSIAAQNPLNAVYVNAHVWGTALSLITKAVTAAAPLGRSDVGTRKYGKMLSLPSQGMAPKETIVVNTPVFYWK